MTDFKVGDTAKVDGSKTRDPKWEGLEYIVVEAVRSSYGKHQMVTGRVTSFNHLAARNGSIVRFQSTQLYPKPFTFADIKVGDKVRRTETWDSGTQQVLEGNVKNLVGGLAYSKEGMLLGYRTDSDNPHITLELLDRPEPHFTEAAEVGTRYRVRANLDGKWKIILTKLEDGRWEQLSVSGGIVAILPAEKAKEFLEEREHELVK